MAGLTGMESAQSEDNLEGKVGGSIPSPSPALNVMANSSRAYSSDDLRSMGAPTSGPSGMPDPPPPHPSPTPPYPPHPVYTQLNQPHHLGRSEQQL